MALAEAQLGQQNMTTSQIAASLTRQEKANAWVRRMRFVMQQANNGGAPTNAPGSTSNQTSTALPSATTTLPGGLPEGGQLSNTATIHQVISQLQEKNNHGQLIQPSLGDQNYQGKMS